MDGDLMGDGAWIAAAREERGLTQTHLVKALQQRQVKITQGWLSRVEAGSLFADGERLAAIAAELGVTPGLLSGDRLRVVPLGDTAAFHRRRASATVGTLRTLHARLNLIRAGLDRLRQVLDAQVPELTAERIEVGGAVTAADAARQTRQLLGVDAGPLQSVTTAAEQIGADVVRAELPGRQVDAASVHPGGETPLFLINAAAPTDRVRFTLAHELGHVVCVNRSTADDETVADRFASELLMPSCEITPVLRERRIDVSRLRVLKQTWGVSAAALARRASDLSVIDDAQYRSLNIEMSMLGWKTGEPDPAPAEIPTVVPTLITRAVATLGLAGTSEAAGVSPQRLSEWFGLDAPALMEGA